MSELPRVSIVMPVKNESAYLERSLGAVLDQDYPAEKIEVLIADGRSTDGTRELARKLAGLRGREVQILDNPAGIVAPGLNAAISAATGEVIVRVDGHCEIPPNYVRRSVEHLRDGHTRIEIAGVGGPIETVGETRVARVVAAAMSSRFGVGGSVFRTGVAAPVLADTVPFPAYPREVLEAAGPFDEELVRNQDDEYNYRLRRAGRKLLLDPAMTSRYYSRASLRSLGRQYFQYGYYKVRVMQKHPRQMRARQFIPPAFVAGLLGSAVAAPFHLVALLVFLTFAGLYGVAVLVASIALRDEVPRRTWILLPLAFAALHLGYGSGFLLGLLRFSGRWGVASSPRKSSAPT